jgi:SWI/SNF-related matrix-associated actin-dependent regulator of chromatin subfamily A member 5
MGSSDNPSSDDKAAQLGKSDLMDILRKGSSALASEDASSVSGAVDFERFLAAPLADLLAASRAKDVARDARARADAGEPMGITVEADGRDEEQLRRDAEAEEAVLLRGVAQVQSRLFEGRLVTQAKAPQGPRWPGDKRVVREIADEWHTLQKRARENRIVVVDGMEFIAPQAVSPVTLSAYSSSDAMLIFP